MLRTFSRVRGRLRASRLDCIASTSGSFQPLYTSETCVAPVTSVCSSSFVRPGAAALLRIRGIHMSSRPLVMLDMLSPLSAVSSSSQASLMQAQRCTIQQQRYLSSNNNKSSPDKPSNDNASSSTDDIASEEPGRLSSIVRSVGPTLRKVTEWNVPDLVSVYAIVLLIALIIFSPYVVE